MEAASALTLLHAAATWALVGLIWTVQLVHYPLLAGFDRTRFTELHAAHSDRITWVVAPLMLAELATAVLLALHLGGAVAWAGLALAVTVWALTAFVSVPCHRVLAGGFDAVAHARLVRTNWLRTAAWSVRGLLAVVLLLDVAGGLR